MTESSDPHQTAYRVFGSVLAALLVFSLALLISAVVSVARGDADVYPNQPLVLVALGLFQILIARLPAGAVACALSALGPGSVVPDRRVRRACVEPRPVPFIGWVPASKAGCVVSMGPAVGEVEIATWVVRRTVGSSTVLRNGLTNERHSPRRREETKGNREPRYLIGGRRVGEGCAPRARLRKARRRFSGMRWKPNLEVRACPPRYAVRYMHRSPDRLGARIPFAHPWIHRIPPAPDPSHGPTAAPPSASRRPTRPGHARPRRPDGGR
jgi:hypothetical protein